MHVVDATFSRSDEFDVELSVCGYESRSTYIARATARSESLKLAIDYQSLGQGDYDDNKAWLVARQTILDTEGETIARLTDLLDDGARARIDISSMRRTTIARVVETVCSSRTDSDVQFVYAPAMYEASSQAVEDHLALSAGPVTRYFSGALRPTSVPLGLIAGLGLEPHRVLGLTELLEPSRVWAFLAVSEDKRFQAAVLEVNQPTIASPQSDMFKYDLRSVADTYAAVESLVYAAGESHRLVLAPSGPKVFALVCLLVAATPGPHQPAVWRVGGSTSSATSGFRAAGDVVAVNVKTRARGAQPHAR